MSIPKIPSNSLYSEAGLNYNKLEDFLASGDWKNADLETKYLILKASREEKKGWLHRIDILSLPSTDLDTINRLWVNYSKGRFGFSIQKHIWLSVGGQIDVYNYEIFKQFSEEVGWFLKAEWLPEYEGSQKDGLWLCYDDLNFSMNAPRGHLPAFQRDGDWLATLALRF